MKRSASNPLKQDPIHFNHGERTLKNCIVCQGNHNSRKQNDGQIG